MATGWIKLHRQSLDNGWLQNHKQWAFWSYCLLKASHKETTVTVGFQRVELNPGQFIFGRKQAAADLALSENIVRTCLAKLKSSKNITIKSTSKFSLVSIVNWHSYQNDNEQDNQQICTESTSNSPTTHHIQEWKNERMEESKTFLPVESCPARSLFDLWNTSVEGTPLSKVKELTEGRSKKCRIRLKERSLGEWREVFSLCAANTFLCGQNDRGWKADFDWIIKNNEGAAKILEGKYSGSAGKQQTTAQRPSPFDGVVM